MFFLVKILISAVLIAFASWLAGRQTILAGFIIALPLVSMLSIFFVYWEYRDMAKVNQFAGSILAAVPLSLLFFVPFILNKWLKMNFAMTYLIAIMCLAFAYFAHHLIFKSHLFH